jgi:uncharacterized protein (DUF362 family)
MLVSEKTRTISILHNPQLAYPEPDEYFSPDEAFPEYRFRQLAKKPNAVYRAVRQCLAGAGLDEANFGTPAWNPLRGHIAPGQKVFVLCNFVQHNTSHNLENIFAKCTHGSVVRAMTDYVLLALTGRGAVRFGNSPLQSCDWAKVIEQTGARRVQEFYQEHARGGPPVELTDLRQHIVRRSALGTIATRFHGEDADSCVPVDLGARSLLEDLYRGEADPRLRVLDYDPRRIERCHGIGRHVYLVSKHVLDCDVVVSIPKLKTHEKVGMTCGIKGCVGSVGHKDCLAHHRYGPPGTGGDEYPDALSFLKPLSSLHDAVYTRPPGSLRQVLHIANEAFRMLVRRFTRSLSGSWPGNDTCWRMAVDLARILEYSDNQGRLCPERQRTHLLLTDGIVGGEGNGPLSPRPVRLGYLSFSDNIAEGDYVNCLAMGFDPERLPVVREAFRLETYPLAPARAFEAQIQMNGANVNVNELVGGLGGKFIPAREWQNYL